MRLTKAQVTNPAALAVILNELHDDITAVRAALPGITAKLDLDAGVTATNYAATSNPAALLVGKVQANQPAITKDPVYT